MKADTNSTTQAQLANADIQWTPLVKGGSNFGIEQLIVVDEDKLAIKATLGLYLFSTFVMFFAPFVIILVFFNVDIDLEGPDQFALVLMGLGFFLAGLKLYLRACNLNITFDRSAGEYIDSSSYSQKPLQTLSLSEIIGLQIIEEYCDGNIDIDINKNRNGISYNSYELNMILQDKSRINIMDHGNEFDLKADAKKLAEFLNVSILKQK